MMVGERHMLYNWLGIYENKVMEMMDPVEIVTNQVVFGFK